MGIFKDDETIAVPRGVLLELVAGFKYYEDHTRDTVQCSCPDIRGRKCGLHEAFEEANEILENSERRSRSAARPKE